MKKIFVNTLLVVLLLSLQSCSDELVSHAIACGTIGCVIFVIKIVIGLSSGAFEKGYLEKEKVLTAEERVKTYFESNPLLWGEMQKVFKEGTLADIDEEIVKISKELTMNAKQKEGLLEYLVSVLKYREKLGLEDAASRKRLDVISEILKEEKKKGNN